MSKATFKNYRETMKDLDGLVEAHGEGPRRAIALQMAQDVKTRARRNAPVGETGNLRRGIVANLFQTPGPSLAYVAIDYRIAPHAHLIEYGHAIVKGGRRKKGGHVIGYVAAIPFMRDAVRETDAARGEALEDFWDRIKRKLGR